MKETVRSVANFLSDFAPLDLKESYDNVGLLVGDYDWEVTGVLAALDATEAVVDEAIGKGCNMIVVHHPILFKGLKKLTGSNYVERTVLKAIRNDIAIYASHTNLDSVKGGVNHVICEKMGLKNLEFLQQKDHFLVKLTVYVPLGYVESVKEVMFNAGGGELGNYNSCSFQSTGVGSFKALDGASPYVGGVNSVHHEDEVRIELVVKRSVVNQVVAVMLEAHPYEEVAYDIISIENSSNDVGGGMVGEFESPISKEEFLQLLKMKFDVGVVRYTDGKRQGTVSKVAVCGGSGAFMLPLAIRKGADVFVSADFKYHEFLMQKII